MRRKGFDQGVGCAAVLPAAIIGFAGLTDGIGPTGWRGFAELFGWVLACMIAAGLLAVLLVRGRRGGVSAYVLTLAAVAGVGVLGYELLSWLGLNAPMSAKALFTRSMQGLGSLGAVLGVLWGAATAWKRGLR